MAAVSGLSGCSYAPQYAATINDAGHVQIEWCYTSADFVIENSSTTDLLRLDAPYDPNSDDFVDIESPSSEWTVSGDLELEPDMVLTVWDPSDYLVAVESTTTTAAGTTAVSVYSRRVQPLLQFNVSALKHGGYFHDGHNISRGAWNDVCDPDDGFGGVGGLLVGALIMVACIIGIVVVFVMSLVQIARDRRLRTR